MPMGFLGKGGKLRGFLQPRRMLVLEGNHCYITTQVCLFNSRYDDMSSIEHNVTTFVKFVSDRRTVCSLSIPVSPINTPYLFSNGK
jgi:hypothetical protein